MCQIPKNHTNLLSIDITSIFIFVMKNRRKIIEEYGHQSRPSEYQDYSEQLLSNF